MTDPGAGGPASSAPAAGLLRRLAAAVYDAFVLLALVIAATFLILPFTGGQAVDPANRVYPFYLLAVCFGVVGWCWTRGGQTVGMRAWRLRVERLDGGAITWVQAALRFAAALLSWAAFGLGYLWCLVDGERRSWPDRLSRTRTVVVR